VVIAASMFSHDEQSIIETSVIGLATGDTEVLSKKLRKLTTKVSWNEAEKFLKDGVTMVLALCNALSIPTTFSSIGGHLMLKFVPRLLFNIIAFKAHGKYRTF
jgi:hypothetical protein